MTLEARALVLPGEQQMARLKLAVSSVVQGWASDWVREWGVDDVVQIELEIVAPEVLTAFAGDTYEALSGEAGTLWLRDTYDDIRMLGAALVGELAVGESGVKDRLESLVRQARHMLGNSLRTALLGEMTSAGFEAVHALPASLFQLGAGAVTLQCRAFGVTCVVDGGVWNLFRSTQGALDSLPHQQSLISAADCATTRLEVSLGSVELTLAALLNLRSGDVLRLPRRLDEPADILCHGAQIAKGALGMSVGRKAVRFVAGRS